MRQQSKESIIILFVGAFLAVNYPVLHLFDRPWAPFGIPILYLYLYFLWIVIIVLLIVVVERSELRGPATPVAEPVVSAETAHVADYPAPAERP